MKWHRCESQHGTKTTMTFTGEPGGLPAKARVRLIECAYETEAMPVDFVRVRLDRPDGGWTEAMVNINDLDDWLTEPIR